MEIRLAKEIILMPAKILLGGNEPEEKGNVDNLIDKFVKNGIIY